MPRAIVLISCVKKKKSTPDRARDLYISAWFRKAWAYAELIGDETYILSAKYGLVQPDLVIQPYELTLKTMKKANRNIWAVNVLSDLSRILKPTDCVTFLAGERYREFLVEPIQRLGCSVEVPMKGLGIGKQLQWLKRNLEHNASAS